MALTLSEMQTEIRYVIKRDSTGGTTAFPDSRITTYVNWAQQQIADQHTFEEMRSIWSAATVDGQKRYPFPSNMKDIYSLIIVDDTDSRALHYVPARDFDDIRPYPEAYTEDTPTHYVDYGTNFELWRIPDTAYTMHMRCSLYPDDLSDSSDTSGLLRKDQLIIAVASAGILRALREFDIANEYEKEASRLLARAVNSDHSAEDWTPVARGFISRSSDITFDPTNPLAVRLRR